MMKITSALTSIFVGAAVAGATALQAEPIEVGARYQVQLKHHDEYSSTSSSGNSNGTDTIVVRVIALRDGGQELEYALPDDATDKDRLIAWQLPARLFVAADGARTLLNRSELETRRDAFLKANGWDKQACGHWLFTWDAFKIECDPDSVFGIVDMFALQPPQLADGAAFTMSGAAGSAPMACVAAAKGEQRCAVTLNIDVDAMRGELAESDVTVGEITGKPITLADAAKARAGTLISGTLEITFEAEADGVVTRRTIKSQTKQTDSSGETLTSTSTAILTRTKL